MSEQQATLSNVIANNVWLYWKWPLGGTEVWCETAGGPVVQGLIISLFHTSSALPSNGQMWHNKFKNYVSLVI